MSNGALPAGGPLSSEMARRIAGFDWGATPVGPVAGWPAALRTLLDVVTGSNQPMFIAWGPELTTFYNDAYAEILAAKHPAALGRPFLEIWHEIRADLRPIVERAQRGEPVQMDDLTLMMERRGYPEETHFAFSYTPIRDDGGAIGGFFCACQEITGQVLAERRLRESEARARQEAERVQLALDAGAILGTWTWHLPTDHFTADERFARSFGLDPEECRRGLGIEQVVATVHPEDKAGLMAAIAEVIARGGPYAHQYRVRGHDGQYRWIEANGRVDHGPDGTPLRFPGVLLDMEERRRTEDSLRQTTRRLDAILNNTREAVFLMDDRQRCVYANAAAETLTGYRFEQMQGRRLHDLVHHRRPDGSHYPLEECPIDRAFPERAQMSGEELFVAPDGSFYPVAFTASPVLDDAGRPIGTVVEARSIAEERARDAALRESEERFRNMAAALPGLLHITSPEGQNLYVNEGFRDYTGLSAEELAGAGWGRVLHPDDAPAAIAAWEEATRTGDLYMAEYRVRRHDGAWRWHATRALPVRREDGTVLHWVGVAIDVHERKGAEEELRARTAEIESLLASAPLGVAFFDREHRWLRINDELAAINGFAVADHIGRRMGELLPVNARLVGPVLDRIFETGEAVRNVEVTGEVPHAPGVPRTWLVNYYPVRDAAGAVASVGTWVVDITERKAAEERLRALTDAIPAFVWFSAPDGAIQSLNERWYDYTGQTPEEALPHGWAAVVHPEDRDRVQAAWQAALATGTIYEVEQRYRRRDGSYRWHVARAVPLRDGRGEVTGWVGTSSDIDDRVQAETALRALNDTLEHRVEEAVARREAAEEALRQSQKMEAVGQLTGGIAHDFNNMLAAVVGSLDLLGRRIDEGDARSRRYVDAAMEGARRAALLTQRLLAFARRQPLRPETVDANRLVEGMLDLLSRSLGAGVRIETALDPGLWRVHADPNQLENVILNLAVNGRDAMPEGGRLVIATANAPVGAEEAREPAGLPPGDYVRIDVRDTGTGMSPEVMAKAFDPFFTTKPVGQGTGLGLSQVYGFVRQSGGRVKLASHPGAGTTVRIYLPRLLGPETEAPPAPVPQELPRGAAQEVVLVVEDEEVVRRFTVEAVAELGYEVLEASGGAEALRLLDGHPEVALLFTDVVMPEMDGRRLADEALRRRPDLKVLFTTGYSRDAVVRDGVLEPGVELIGKPFTVEELAARLRGVLDGG